MRVHSQRQGKAEGGAAMSRRRPDLMHSAAGEAPAQHGIDCRNAERQDAPLLQRKARALDGGNLAPERAENRLARRIAWVRGSMGGHGRSPLFMVCSY
jgi:hypothetical protein